MATEARYRITLDATQALREFKALGLTADQSADLFKKFGNNADDAFLKLGEGGAKAGDKVVNASGKAVSGIARIRDVARTVAPALSDMGSKARDINAIATTARGVASSIRAIASEAIEATGDLLEFAAKGSSIQTLKKGFEALGGTASDIEKLRDATANAVPDAALIKMSNLGKLSKISNDNLNKLAKIATGAAATLGVDMEDAFKRIVSGSAKLEKEVLDELGIKLGNLTQVYADYAHSIGKSSKALSDQEKQTAFVNEIMATSGKQLEMQQLAQGDAFNIARAQAENFYAILQMGAADVVGASGIFQILGDAMRQIQAEFAGSKDELALLLRIGVQQAVAFLPVFVDLMKLLATQIPPLIALFQGLRGVITLGLKVLQVYGAVLGWLATNVIGLFVSALGKMLSAIVSAADAVGVDLPDGVKRAATEMENAYSESQKLGEGLTELPKSVDGVSGSFELMTAKAEKLIVTVKGVGDVATTAGSAFSDMMLDLEDASAAHEANARAADESAIAYGNLVIAGDNGRDAIAQLVIDSHKGYSKLAFDAQESAKNQAQALDFLAKKYQAFLEARRAMERAGMTGISDAQLAQVEASFDQAYAEIEAVYGKTEKAQKKSSRNRRDVAAEGRELLMSELDREIMETEKKYGELINKLKGHEELKLQLTAKMQGEIATLRVEAATKELENAEQVHLALMDQRKRHLVEEQNAIRDRFAALAALTSDPATLGALRTEEARLLDIAQASSDMESLKEMGAGLQAFFTPVMGRIQEDAKRSRDFFRENAQESKKQAKFWADSFQQVGTTFGQTMGQMIGTGQSSRQQIFQMMGQMFGQLGSAFLSWATAESALLSGNPILGATAAIALTTVASLISSFGSRGGSGGGSGATTAPAAAARDFSAGRAQQDQKANVIVYNYGFQAPAEVAQRVGQSAQRAADLRGKS